MEASLLNPFVQKDEILIAHKLSLHLWSLVEEVPSIAVTVILEQDCE